MLWVISTINLSAQKIRVEYNHTPLNQILTEIRDKYSINLSFDNKELAKYRVTVNKYFDTPDKAFDFLLKNLPIAYEKHSNVFLFYKNEKLIVKVKSYRLSGKIYDKKNKADEDAMKKAQGVQKAKIHKPDIKPTIRTKASK